MANADEQGSEQSANPRFTPLWERQGKMWHEAYVKLMADPQARLRWFHYAQCLVQDGILPRDRYAVPQDPSDRAAVEKMHEEHGSNPSDAFVVFVREVDRVAPALSHSLGPFLVNWIIAKTFAATGVSPSVPLSYGPVRLAPDNPVMMRADGTFQVPGDVSSRHLLELDSLIKSLRPERPRGRRAHNTVAKGRAPSLDPARCEEALRLQERGKTLVEIAVAIFGDEVLADQRTRERLRGQVRRYIARGRSNRSKKVHPTKKSGTI
jgi:hypothetical protein